jgi:hypothetical protein
MKKYQINKKGASHTHEELLALVDTRNEIRASKDLQN